MPSLDSGSGSTLVVRGTDQLSPIRARDPTAGYLLLADNRTLGGWMSPTSAPRQYRKR